MSRTDDKRSLATLLIGIVQVVGGIATGGMAGLYLFLTALKLQRAFGITDPHGPIGHGVGATGFWMIWIVTFMVVFAICVAASVSRHTRPFGIAAAASFTLLALEMAWALATFEGPS
ncbi:hypothetical protein AB0H00_14175 [Nocardia sp. NPDC023852]|uniref:hypothetical protein n=1 Tax=Nocardia sp. NPDC023852 TaxID=3154697 RepID=UPI0033F7C30F